MRCKCLVGLFLFFIAFLLGQGYAEEETPVFPGAVLPPAMPRELREVVEGAGFVAEKRDLVFKGHPKVYEYLLNHLDFTSQLGRALDLSDFVIKQTGTGTYKATTPRGGWAHLKVVYADREKRVVFAQGKYARAVVVLQYASFDRGGESYMENNLYGYVRADNPVLSLLLIPFGGLLNHRVTEVFTSVTKLSERVYEAPASVYREILTHSELSSENVLEFAAILERL